MIFVLIFCLCFMHKFHYILESVYWFHSIVAPCMCACLVLCLFICQVGSHSELSVISVHYVVTYANHTFGGHWFIINRTDIWHKIRLDRATRKEWWASENILCQDFFMRYGTLNIDLYLFDNLMHFKYYRVCIGVRYDVCKLGNSHSPLYTGLELYI